MPPDSMRQSVAWAGGCEQRTRTIVLLWTNPGTLRPVPSPPPQRLQADIQEERAAEEAEAREEAGDEEDDGDGGDSDAEAEEGGCETDDGMEAGWSARWYPQNSGPSLWPGALYLLMSRIITYTYTLSLALTLTLSLSILPLSLPSVSLAPCTCSCLE